MKAATLLHAALTDPRSVIQLSPSQWDLLIRLARRANLLARLEQMLLDSALMDAVPAGPRRHLLAARAIAQRQAVSVRWEVECIRQSLAASGTPVILLKGAAYVLAKLPVADGRLFSDVDILVPESQIAGVESALMLNGWQASHHDDYDQRFYRAWMHEIPPMRHVRRDTTIDVHHSILPKTARVKVDTSALMESALPLAGEDKLFVLQPIDMLLHSATHLFHEGEFANGMRDLFDLDSLMRHFGTDRAFWDALVPRATALGLGRPLYYALRTSKEILETPVPGEVLDAARVNGPPAWLASIMVCCYRLALRPVHASADTSAVKLARLSLYVRSHWLRLPIHLLVYHLGRKAFLRIGSGTADPSAKILNPLGPDNG